VKIRATLLFFLSAASIAHARLGETPAQVAARFGTCIDSTIIKNGADAGLDLRQFNKQGFTILVWFEGVSVAEDYQTCRLTENQIETLLSDNCGGYHWKKEPSLTGKLWVRTDGATARLSGDSEIEFKSKGFIKKQSEFKQAQKSSVDGF
jgi:hypothetical protein